MFKASILFGIGSSLGCEVMFAIKSTLTATATNGWLDHIATGNLSTHRSARLIGAMLDAVYGILYEQIQALLAFVPS